MRERESRHVRGKERTSERMGQRERKREREKERERGGYSEKTIERGESAQRRAHAKKKRDRSALRNTEIMADTLRLITVWARESAHTRSQHKTERPYRPAEHSLFCRSCLQHYVPEVGGQKESTQRRAHAQRSEHAQRRAHAEKGKKDHSALRNTLCSIHHGWDRYGACCHGCLGNLSLCRNLYVCVCACVCVCVCVSEYIYIYIRICVCMCVGMYICIYVYVCLCA